MAPTKTQASELAELAETRKLRRRLDFVYEPVPSFKCFDGCSACCFNSAEVRPVEYANILNHLRQMPAQKRDEIIRKTVLYEFLHLVTLDHKCSFLNEDKCEIYDVRPLQCRFFGLYPDSEYQEQKDQSLEANKELLSVYKKHLKMALPADVITYDVDQCDAARQDGNYLVMPAAERTLVEDRIATIEQEILELEEDNNDDEASGHERFSLMYCSGCLGDDEMQLLRVAAIKEFNESGTHEVIDTMLALGRFNLD